MGCGATGGRGFVGGGMLAWIWWCLRTAWSWGLTLALVALVFATLTPWLTPEWNWYLEIATNFQLQWIAGVAIVAVLLALSRYWRRTGLALLWLLLALGVHVLPLYVSDLPHAAPDAPMLKVMCWNVYFPNDERQPFFDFVEQEKPDVILLLEIDRGGWERSLEPLKLIYPYHLVVPSAGSSGVALFSKLPLENAHVELVGVGVISSLTTFATIVWQDRPVSLVGVHPISPNNLVELAYRNLQLKGIAEKVVQQPKPVLVMGDFNASSWSPSFRKFLADTGLRDTRKGFGPQPSWCHIKLPAWLFGRIPIDHSLISADLAVANRRLGPALGSDHLPVILDLTFRIPPTER